jgi:hypothetical protein
MPSTVTRIETVNPPPECLLRHGRPGAPGTVAAVPPEDARGTGACVTSLTNHHGSG